MARAALGWTVRDLADATGLHRNTISNIETGRTVADPATLRTIEGALTRAGIHFIGENGVASRASQNETHMGKNVGAAAGRLSSAQIRAGRALLRWSARDLARKAALGLNTIRRAEVAEQAIALTAANDIALRRTLEAAGVDFIDENGGGPGVRLRKRPRK